MNKSKNERRSKKYNLIIYNLAGKNILETVIELFNQKLVVSCVENDIRDAYRLNSGDTPDKPKPIIIEFTNSRIKSKILSHAKNLKGTGIYISLDYTSEDYQKKKLLFHHQKLARQQGRTASIRGNSLIIDGTPYDVEELQDDLTRLPRSDSTSSNSSTSKTKTHDLDIEKTQKKTQIVYRGLRSQK
ncbi:unnamed protein product [Psylliodes chrysocephalus]|uniref:Uncharacterized protein n=1 Tax=Psylliodes chrysocephalus TaxID=3402493 RepID=A0A9P0G732_9CUCU|nr:unnamed protein product [Psylliodes chrysocephala]